ncbi:MAG: LPS export ABC transporter periplasmic protein LptC [Ferruginibacter sp.]
MATCCLFFTACENDEDEVKNFGKKATGTEEARDVVITFTTGGRTKAILKSPLMLHVLDSSAYIEFPKTLLVDFYNDSTGKIESTLTAQYARYKESEEVIYLRDSVQVKNTKGEVLYAQDLYWNRKRVGWEFYTEKPIRIRTLTHFIDGVGLEASQDFKQRLIKKPTGIVNIPSSKFPQ